MKISKLFKYLVTSTLLLSSQAMTAEINQVGLPIMIMPSGNVIKGIISQDSALIFLKGMNENPILVSGSEDDSFDNGTGIYILGGKTNLRNVIGGENVIINANDGNGAISGFGTLDFTNVVVNTNNTTFKLDNSVMNVVVRNSELNSDKNLYENNNSILDLDATDSKLSGRGNITDDSKANVTLNSSTWNVNGDTKVTNLLINNSNLVFISNADIDRPNVNFQVNENYSSDNGTLTLNLYTKNNQTVWDNLTISGNASGTTYLKILDKTTQTYNFKEAILISVNGLAENNSETFILEDYKIDDKPVVSVGSYVYDFKYRNINGVNEWFLESNETITDNNVTKTYNAAIPLYETYTNILLKMNEIDSYKERMNGRTYSNNFWIKGSGLTGKFAGDKSTTNSNYNIRINKVQIGIDFNISDSFTGGLFVQYGNGKSKINSTYGSGKITSDFYGFGGNLTYTHNDFYVDSQYQLLWFKNDIYSNQFNKNMASNNKAFGYNFGIEVGKRFYKNGFVITPQFQVSYNNVRFDEFYDSTDSRINGNHHGIINTRIGVSVDKQFNNLKINGILNIYQDFNSKTELRLADARLDRKEYATRLGIGAGFDYTKGKYSVFGSGEYRPAFNDFGKNYDLRGSIGLRIKF